jgi:pimeloyl-ACP methyl ester carboxylesterase
MRRLVTVLGVLTESVTILPGTVRAQAAYTEALTVRPITFVSAKGDSVPAEAGTLRVPENRRNPASRAITIAFVRFTSTAAVPGPPIIYLAGGPGNSGIAAARGTRFPLFMALRAVGDVIALDARGIGESRPSLGCRETADYPLDQPGDRERLIELVRAKSRACAAFWRDRGVDLRGFTVDESADDIDALREALGAAQVTLWGISYGTTLAVDVIRRHPTRVHQAILAGTEGTDDMLKRPAAVDSMLFVFDALARRDSVVGADMPDLVGTMRATMARL